MEVITVEVLKAVLKDFNTKIGEKYEKYNMEPYESDSDIDELIDRLVREEKDRAIQEYTKQYVESLEEHTIKVEKSNKNLNDTLERFELAVGKTIGEFLNDLHIRSLNKRNEYLEELLKDFDED